MEDLYIFVEGPDEERLFSRVMVPIIKGIGAFHPILWPYRESSKKEIIRRIQILTQMKAPYVFVSDLDKAPCISARKMSLSQIYDGIDENCIVVVVKAIEGWYAAGLTMKGCEKLGLPEPQETEKLNHARFGEWISKKLGKESIAKIAILCHYSPKVARKRNPSFDYFFQKFCC